MENGKYRLKDSYKSNPDVELEIEVVDYIATCTKVGSVSYWEIGERMHVEDLLIEAWELIPNEETSLEESSENLTPHKYADVIKAWADGHEVQSYSSFADEWWDEENPNFNPCLEWRIKPDNPNQDRILEIEKTITELQNELEELKNS